MNEFSQFLDPIIQSTNYTVLPLAGDASTRRYYRIVTENKTWVLMQWDPFKDEANFPFLSVQKYFQISNICVPEIFEIDQKKGLFLLEDLGDLTLERRFWEFQDQNVVLPLYKETLDELIKIHSLCFERQKNETCTAYDIEFSVEKLMWEFNYMKKYLLENLLEIPIDVVLNKKLENTFLDICNKLYSSPQVICHRDFHSRNVMLKYGKISIIDFQDARMGPPVYDLVSLLHDSYVELNETSRQILLDYYISNFPYWKNLNMSQDQFLSFFDLQTLQRCFKACGSFASFKVTRDDHRYLHYIAPTLNKLLSILNSYPEYSVLSELLEEHKDQWQNI